MTTNTPFSNHENDDEFVTEQYESQFTQDNKIFVSLIDNTAETQKDVIDSRLLALSIVEAYQNNDVETLEALFSSSNIKELVPSLTEFSTFMMSLFAASYGWTSQEAASIIRKNILLAESDDS